jgi:ribose transport system ATP-binding protein
MTRGPFHESKRDGVVAEPSPPLLDVCGVTKAFSGIAVLKQVSLQLGQGEVLGLVGENGAGKSTLMNILGGNLQPDAGQIRLSGQEYAPRGPGDAGRAGIAFVHQELNLFPNLSIAENLFIREFPQRGFPGLRWIDRKTARERCAALLAQVGLSVEPETLVSRLSAGERQLVEIAKALSLEARIVILDEPTTSLTSREREHLFRLLRFVRARGVSMIYISHSLGDVLRLCDSVAVLRDGEVVGCGPRASFTSDALISLMVGRNITQLFPTRPVPPPGKPLLEVRNVSQPGIVNNISFTLSGGEVLGIAGLMGSGRSELARILFGLDPFTEGEIKLGGGPVDDGARGRIQHGVAFLTEDRREEGLCLNASIAENIALVTLPGLAPPPFRLLDLAARDQAVIRIRQAVRLTASASNDQAVQTLSGGNQQKVVLAKWLLARPSVFIMDEPTRGIDVGAKVEIYGLINDLVAGGAGVLVISSELEELIGICDRILVMNQGQLRDELRRAEFDRERILRSALSGSSPDRGGDES